MTDDILKTTDKKKKKKNKILIPNDIQIEWLTKSYGIAQVYSSGLEYCFISKDFKQACPFIYCESFLQDALMAYHNGKCVNIYGFKYNPKTDEPIYLDRIRLAITNAKDSQFASKIPAMLDFLRQIERELKLIRSVARPITNLPKKYQDCGVYLLEGSNRWMRSPPMISLYSLLVRIGFTHTVGNKYATTIKNLVDKKIKPYQTNDITQITNAKTGLSTILKYGYAKIFFKDEKKNFPAIAEHDMHYNMGITAFSNNQSKSHVKYWHRDYSKKLKKKEETKTTQALQGAAT